MNNDEKSPNYNVFNGDNSLIPHVTFSRKGTHYCIYCGSVSDTREHVPSKVFLSKPYPMNLPVLPACHKCNNGYSVDELYTEMYIDSIKYLSGHSIKILDETEKYLFSNSAFPDSQTDLAIYYDTGDIPKRQIIKRILAKLAVGHAVYELSTGYFSDSFTCKPISIKYKFLFELSGMEKEDFNSLINMENKVLPEIGSRIFNKLFVFERVSKNDNDKLISSIPVLSWSNIQHEQYRYIAWFETRNIFRVKIVIHDFLFSEVMFKVTE